jgi:hypothetical protein
MNKDQAVTGTVGRIRALAAILLVAMLVVPALALLQSEEAGAEREPIERVAPSRFDLPSDRAGSLETPDAAIKEASQSAPLATAPSVPTIGSRTPGVSPAMTTAGPVRTVATRTHIASNPLPARLIVPADPFQPEPPPVVANEEAPNPSLAGGQSPALHPVEAAPAISGGRDMAAVTPSASGSAPRKAAALAARPTPDSGAQRPAPVPVAQPLAEPAPVPPPTPLTEVRLRGVIRGTPDLALILIAGQTYFLKAGDTVEGAWVVGEIKDNSVVLRSGDHVRELQIEGGSPT